MVQKGLKKVVWWTSRCRLSQVFNNGLEYSFVSDDGKQCHPMVFCKDFLQDAIYNQLWNTNYEIYGFCFGPQNGITISVDQLNLLLANSSDPKMEEKIPNCMDFINQIENKLKLKHTIIFKCKSPPIQYIRSGVWWLQGSNKWLISPPMISLYTLMLRVGFCHIQGKDFKTTIKDVIDLKIDQYQEKDAHQLKRCETGFDKILKHSYKIFHNDIKDNYPKETRIERMHNSMGIIAFSNGNANHICVKQ